jgi:hypothetical protein
MKIEHIINLEHRTSSIRDQVILYKGEAFSFFDAGLTRYVFTNADKTKVIKILIDKSSKDYNLEEAEIYTNASKENKSQMAKTILTYNGSIIEQEFCNPIKFDDRDMTIPQILFASKCRNEVGWNNEGKLVCFDLDEFKKY